MSGEQNARHNHHIKTANKPMEKCHYAEYLDITLTDKVTYMKTLKAEENKEMSGSIWYRIFCVPVYYQRRKRLIYTELYCCLLFYVGVKLGLVH